MTDRTVRHSEVKRGSHRSLSLSFLEERLGSVIHSCTSGEGSIELSMSGANYTRVWQIHALLHPRPDVFLFCCLIL